MAFFTPLSDADVDVLFAEADGLLETVGVDIADDPESLARLDAAGARIDGNRVRFPAGLATALIRDRAPARFRQHARNPGCSVEFGGERPVFAPASGPPFVRDPASGRRRYATLADFERVARMVQASTALAHAGGGYCEPSDRGPLVRHLDMLYTQLLLTDKPLTGAIRDAEQVRDSLAMVGIACGDPELTQCALLNLFNIEPPLVLPGHVAAGIRLTAAAGQACLVSAYAMPGMTSPVSLPAALAQMLAEVQAGAALAQCVRPGAPVICGIYAVPFSMSAMRPAFGAIESALVMAAGAQLVHRLGVPFRADGAVTAAKMLDAQAGRDSALGLGVAHAVGSAFVLHAAGWLESGLSFCCDKFAHDVATIDTLHGDPLAHVTPVAHAAGATVSAGDLLAAWRQPPMAADRAEALAAYREDRRQRYQADGPAAS
jgi:trimethylamine---corrinoid protein Co-methyltransferase